MFLQSSSDEFRCFPLWLIDLECVMSHSLCEHDMFLTCEGEKFTLYFNEVSILQCSNTLLQEKV